MATKLKLPIKGRAVAPGLRLTPPVLEFGDVVTNAYADHLIVALNTSSTLPLKYKVGEGGG